VTLWPWRVRVPRMKTVCAASVLFGEEAFSTLGEVVVVPDGEITPADIAAADALVTRSKTRINADLLAGSNVRFVGTATAGFDHIDTAWLEQAGIVWTQAPGCNANSVAEYITAAWLKLAVEQHWQLDQMALGVIGVGQVGSRVVKKAEALGMTVLKNDPPLRAETGDPDLLPLEDVIHHADILTLHVPLTYDGPWPTFHLVDTRLLARMTPGVVFMNASRGEVVDTDALLLGMDEGVIAHAVLDVWEHEPFPAPAIMTRADLATPHIAGYSIDGKLKGTLQIYRELCHFFELSPTWTPPALPSPEHPECTLVAMERDEEMLWQAVHNAYDIEADDQRMRTCLNWDRDEIGRHFSALRKNYPVRREFPSYYVYAQAAPASVQTKLAGLGFEVSA